MRSVNEDRLQKTLEYILEYQKRESKAPTYRQIQKECGYNSSERLQQMLHGSRSAT